MPKQTEYTKDHLIFNEDQVVFSFVNLPYMGC